MFLTSPVKMQSGLAVNIYIDHAKEGAICGEGVCVCVCGGCVWGGGCVCGEGVCGEEGMCVGREGGKG